MRRLAPLSALALVAVLLAAQPSGAGTPAVQPANRSTHVPGAENGLVPDHLLVTVAPGCRVERNAAPSLRLLLETAHRRGVALGLRSCYRPLADQIAVLASWTARGNSACAASVQRSPSGQPVGTSIHGWGKAVDFSDGGRAMTFGSPGYWFLKAEAGRFGWNHPGWAEPGGSACPEAWHWEWVGDGGTLGGDPIRADVVSLLRRKGGRGYSSVTALGGLVHRGSAVDRGSAASLPISSLVVGGAPAPDGGGYWLVAADGGVFSYGTARYHGSMGGRPLASPIVGMAAARDGKGYWLVAADGGVFGFGSARFKGSMGGKPLVEPIVGMAGAPDGKGYWLVAADGGIFRYGTATWAGSMGGRRLAQPVVGIAAGPGGDGYWLAAADGGVFGFGSARFRGSMGGKPLSLPVVAIAPDGRGGYWLASADGGVFAFGGARFYGAG